MNCRRDLVVGEAVRGEGGELASVAVSSMRRRGVRARELDRPDDGPALHRPGVWACPATPERAEAVGQPACHGVINEVLVSEPRPRYRILWDDGQESIYTSAAGALRAAELPEV
jgi:hypothetical protein